MPKMKPDAGYVSKLLMQLENEMNGLHTKITEIEALRYYEDVVQLPVEERRVGLEVRSGLTAELIESVKASVLGNPPKVRVHAHSDSPVAQDNASNREKFWNEFLRRVNSPVPVINEFADSVIGNGIGVLKASYCKYPTRERYKKRNETEAEHTKRVKALKKKWGPPIGVVTVHPLSYYPRPGVGHKISESIEHSYKSKLDIYEQYNIASDADLNAKVVPMLSGLPDTRVRPLAAGVDTSTMVLVDEYYNDSCYQVYINNKLVYEETDPAVAYFLAMGRTSSSKDPDKMGISVAEGLRKNEPIINRTLTRMAEAADLLVHKRLTLVSKEGTIIPGTGEPTSMDNNTSPSTISLKEDSIEVLPEGSDIRDPFESSYHVYESMPFLNLLMGLMSQQGVSPLIKGIPSGAAGSGYRDNSLYLMARSQFQYILDSIQGGLSSFIMWCEDLLVNHIKEPIYCGEFELSPSEVEGYPATVSVLLDPVLPQNYIAEGNFYQNMHASGAVSMRRWREQGIGIEQPEEEERQIMLEKLQLMLEPMLLQDVVKTVVAPPEPSGLVDQNGQPLQSPNGGMQNGGPPGGGGVDMLMAAMGGNGRTQASGGYATQGITRQPPQQPGTLPGG